MTNKKDRRKPYKIIGAYDSETCNLADQTGNASAYPILHQLGLLSCPIEVVTADNAESVIDIELYRHTVELTARLDDLADTPHDYVPVICCHNLSFDMHPLAEWLNYRDAKVLAKSKQKPITFTICDDGGNPVLVLWDTLIFAAQSLAKMGIECGYQKAIGKWNYNLIRTPETPLTDDELEYAKADIYTLLVWLSWWLAHNPDIKPDMLALNVVSKTGVVRALRKIRYGNIKGQGRKDTVAHYWFWNNQRELPQSDDELMTLHAATRGGFTFCATSSASKPYDLPVDYVVAGFDAVSMHPSHMVSHRYPHGFTAASKEFLDAAFDLVASTSVKYVLKHFNQPFGVGIYAAYRFTNLRLKSGSIFAKCGIGTLASARFSKVVEIYADNGNSELFAQWLKDSGYKDAAKNPVYAFGKLMSADECVLYLTELEIWILSRAYEWDSSEALHGYATHRYQRPTDMAVISVMRFYDAKNAFKIAMSEYFETATISKGTAESLRSVNIAEGVIQAMQTGDMTDIDVKAAYQQQKANLNSLFGIEASNEFRQDTVLKETGIEYDGTFGIECAPKNPKAHYQFGQRIVGWSRVAQVLVLELIKDHVETVINGDTDSIKVLCKKSKLQAIDKALSRYAKALDVAKGIICKRVKAAYPHVYSSLDSIGHYECELSTRQFCAAWNKSYLYMDGGKLKITMAGIPAYRGLEGFATELMKRVGFTKMCSLIMGYNICLDYSLTHLNQRVIPEWGATYCGNVTDYRGETSYVVEPCAIGLYPMPKYISDVDNGNNRADLAYAQANNPDINITPMLLYIDGRGDYAQKKITETPIL